MSKLGNKNTKLSARLQKVETRYNSNDMLLGRELTAQEKRQRNKEMIRQHKQKKRDEEIKKQQKGKAELKTSLLSLNVHKPW